MTATISIGLAASAQRAIGVENELELKMRYQVRPRRSGKMAVTIINKL